MKLISDTPTSSGFSNLSLYEIYTEYINFISTLTTIQVGSAGKRIIANKN